MTTPFHAKYWAHSLRLARNAGNGAITAKGMGAIYSRGVRELVEEMLEGGRRAFELRRQKYGV